MSGRERPRPQEALSPWAGSGFGQISAGRILHQVRLSLGLPNFRGLNHIRQVGTPRCREWQGLHSFVNWTGVGRTGHSRAGRLCRGGQGLWESGAGTLLQVRPGASVKDSQGGLAWSRVASLPRAVPRLKEGRESAGEEGGAPSRGSTFPGPEEEPGGTLGAVRSCQCLGSSTGYGALPGSSQTRAGAGPWGPLERSLLCPQEAHSKLDAGREACISSGGVWLCPWRDLERWAQPRALPDLPRLHGSLSASWVGRD